jgi:L-ascorbate metabolism protein UlaG (beta-lactamase superfamily)
VVARSRPEIVVETHDWREEVEIGGGATVWLAPRPPLVGARHRRPAKALWCGYVIATSVGAVYIAGDTGYGDGRIFLEVADRHPVVDVAVLPIGAYAPRWFMKDQHVNPAEAVRIMQDCGARQALGVHWGAFPPTDEARSDPADALAEALRKLGSRPGGSSRSNRVSNGTVRDLTSLPQASGSQPAARRRASDRVHLRRSGSQSRY